MKGLFEHGTVKNLCSHKMGILRHLEREIFGTVHFLGLLFFVGFFWVFLQPAVSSASFHPGDLEHG